jgi:hypothetical protein
MSEHNLKEREYQVMGTTAPFSINRPLSREEQICVARRRIGFVQMVLWLRGSFKPNEGVMYSDEVLCPTLAEILCEADVALSDALEDNPS